jgi:predicted ABC-type ATPase
MQTTKEFYCDGTSYSESRQKLHESIIKTLLKNLPREVNDPIAILLGGGAASGKSTIGERYKMHLKKYGKMAVYVDCDEIKERIPEYKTLQSTNPLNAADLVHDESSDISLMLLEKAIENKCDIFYDGTMKSKEKYEALIHQLHEKGYEVFAVVVDVPLDIAFKRSHDRYLLTQRMVSETTILESHKGVAETFQHLKELFDSYALWDNTEYGGEGEIVAEKDGTVEKVYNEARLNQFYQKSVIDI